MDNNRAERARQTMADRKMNCAQSVLDVFCEDYGLDHVLAKQIAQGFGGGMGHTGQTCGTVSGAYMVLGMANRITSENPRENIDKVYALVKEFNREFRRLYGSLDCTELCGYDLTVPEKLTEANEKKVFTTVCPDFVRDAVKITESLLARY